MGYLITTADFQTGMLKLPRPRINDNLQEYIDRFEKQYLIRILGGRLYEELIADLSGASPQSAKWDAVVNGTTYVNDQDETVIFEGILFPLKTFIYWHFVRDGNVYLTNNGAVEPQNENSNTLSSSKLTAELQKRWNLAIPIVLQCQEMLEYFESYSETSGLITDLGGGQYSVDLEFTWLLEAGDTVTINGVDCTVISVTENDSITVTAAEDIAGTGQPVSWDIFGDYDQAKMEYLFLGGFA